MYFAFLQQGTAKYSIAVAQEPQRPNLKTEVPGPNTKRLFEQLNSIQVPYLLT